MNNFFSSIKFAVVSILISLHFIAAPVAPVVAPTPDAIATDSIQIPVPVTKKVLPPRSASAVPHVKLEVPTETFPVSSPAPTAQVAAPQVIYVQVPVQQPKIDNPMLPQTDPNAPASMTTYNVVPQQGSPFQERTGLTEDQLRAYAEATTSYPGVVIALQNKSIDDVIAYLNSNGFTVTTN